MVHICCFPFEPSGCCLPKVGVTTLMTASISVVLWHAASLYKLKLTTDGQNGQKKLLAYPPCNTAASATGSAITSELFI